jgi:hypothetical protein
MTGPVPNRGPAPRPAPKSNPWLGLVVAAASAYLAFRIGWGTLSSPMILTASPFGPAVSILAAIALGVIAVWVAARSFGEFPKRSLGRLATSAVAVAGVLALLVIALPLGLGPRPRHQRRAGPTGQSRSVVGTTPADGERNVPVDSAIVLRLDGEAAGVPRGTDLSKDGTQFTVTTDQRLAEERMSASEWSYGRLTLSRGGDELRFTPDLPLRPGHTYKVSFQGQIGPSDNAAGACLLHGASFQFTTAPQADDPEADASGTAAFRPEKIHVGVVSSGALEVVALPGALLSPGRGSAARIGVSAVREGEEICRSLLDPDPRGGFYGRLGRRDGCTLADNDAVVVLILDGDGNVTHRFLPSFRLASDRRSFVVPPEQALSIETREGLVIEVPGDALPWVYRIALGRAIPTMPSPPTPEGLASAGRYTLEIECLSGLQRAGRPIYAAERQAQAVLNTTLRVLIPAPPDTDLEARAYWAMTTPAPKGDPRLALVSVGAVVAHSAQPYLSNRPGLQPDTTGKTCADVIRRNSGPCLVADYLPELRASCDFTVLYERGTRWALVVAGGFTTDSFSVAVSAASPDFLGRSWLSRDGVMLAVPASRTAEITVTDLSTSWRLAECRRVRPDTEGRQIVTTKPL